MMTVHQVSKLTGVSIRTLQYYDRIGLLKPDGYTEAGYRLYDDSSLERLQQILLFRELEFPLKEIRGILNAPNFDRNKALEQQIELLTLKKEHLENLIDFARGIQWLGVKKMDFTAFDTRKIDEYAKRAKEQWGKTEEYREFEEKAKNWTKDEGASGLHFRAFLSVFRGDLILPGKDVCRRRRVYGEHRLSGRSGNCRFYRRGNQALLRRITKKVQRRALPM